MDASHRRWSWIAFATGLAAGIMLGVVGLVVLMQLLTVMISP
jgi:hypothetical protein